MSKKIIIITIILLAGLIGLILLKSGGGTSMSSGSPEAVVKNFFEAVKKGDFEGAEEYISLENTYYTSVESFFKTSFCNSFNLSKAENQSLEKECLTSLGKAIDNIKIEDKQTEKALGIEQAVLAVKIDFKSGAKEEAQGRLEEEKNKPVIQQDSRVILKSRFLAKFSEAVKVFLEKYEQGWKIVDIEL